MENKREINNNELPTQKNQKQDGQEIKDQENKEHEVKDQEMTDQEMTEQQEKDLLDDSQADICVQLREITVNTPTKEDLEQGTKVSKNIKQASDKSLIDNEPIGITNLLVPKITRHIRKLKLIIIQ